MLMDDLQQKFENMDQAELEDYFSKLRSRTRDKKTGTVKTAKKTNATQLKKLLDSLSPEQRTQLLTQLGSKKG